MENPAENSQNITRMLKDWSDGGNREALDQLLPFVYDELHRQASRYLRRERSDHTLQATALIHEAYLKLIDQREVECNAADSGGLCQNQKTRKARRR